MLRAPLSSGAYPETSLRHHDSQPAPKTVVCAEGHPQIGGKPRARRACSTKALASQTPWRLFLTMRRTDDPRPRGARLRFAAVSNDSTSLRPSYPFIPWHVELARTLSVGPA